MKKTALVILLYLGLFVLGISAQNTQPIALPDTLTMTLNDSLSINLLSNDYDQQGDPMKITKFDRYSISTFKTFKNDTGVFYINKNGRVSVKGLKVGQFTYKYIVQDGKAGAGRTGLFTLIIKGAQSEPSNWMDIGTQYVLIHKDSVGYITAQVGSKVYSGKVVLWSDGSGCSVIGQYYKQWHGAELKTITGQFVLYLHKDIYGWAQL